MEEVKGHFPQAATHFESISVPCNICSVASFCALIEYWYCFKFFTLDSSLLGQAGKAVEFFVMFMQIKYI